MRKLNTGDVFKMARILKNGNIMQNIRDAFVTGKSENADSQQIGMDLIMNVLCSCSDTRVEDQIYELLGGVCEKKPEDIKNQSLEKTIEDIKKICEENNISNFLKSASSLSGKTQG